MLITLVNFENEKKNTKNLNIYNSIRQHDKGVKQCRIAVCTILISIYNFCKQVF